MHICKAWALALFITLAAATGASAQTNLTLGAVNADPTAPVEITADSLEVDQDTGKASFSGNVEIGQGDLRLTAARVDVTYNDQTGAIDNLRASGGVTFVTPTEAAEAQRADYDIAGGTLVLEGQVLVTQGGSALSAERMRVDLRTGSARMDGQVRTILNPDDG
ncbi:MAG: lipopolysaccharide transport periplasmic protein LptA [Salibaculum sp.]|uniref:lipopolysaccharide transport periplasmic protein LptA n=1 Tax=Salibaculum sp. TaxID=2855480 RepID=UPI00286FF4CC|nr:lipopolysaccharide transport periplasmic protein LptA [Salibaculum sp.]MDR9426764.1 lipopolysaccharide transport periplasmic protein LptA [Salibaculum sp.]MDR9481320.1 lipopolysaccharide transport periplasmic protein LptA [Salibaculum sp.]